MSVIKAALVLGGVLVAGKKGQLRAMIAVGDGDAGVGWPADGRGDARDNLERHPGLRKLGSFFADSEGSYTINRVEVDAKTREWSLVALERMLALP